jgi:hypothetical protein
VALADDLDVRVAVRLQLLPDLGFGHRLDTGKEHGSSWLCRRDQDTGRCNERGSTGQGEQKSTIHGFLQSADILAAAARHSAFNAALSLHRLSVKLR